MEIKKIEKCDYVMFPRLQEQGVETTCGDTHSTGQGRE